MSGPLGPLLTIFERDVIAERWRQLKKWGRQSHLDGTGHPGDRALADFYKKLCDAQFEHGSGTWRHVLAEEVAEAFAESERQPLRAELIQVATVALAWVEDLDRRSGDREPEVPPVLPKLGDDQYRNTWAWKTYLDKGLVSA